MFTKQRNAYLLFLLTQVTSSSKKSIYRHPSLPELALLCPLTGYKFQNMSSHHMDGREHSYEALDICNRLYNFVLRIFSAHAFKTVTLGAPRSGGAAKTRSASVFASKYDQAAHPTSQAESRGESRCVANSDHSVEDTPTTTASTNDATEGIADRLDAFDERKKQEEEVSIALVAPEPKAWKKSVGINERVEEIGTRKKETRRKKSKEGWSSFEEQDIKELRPILKL